MKLCWLILENDFVQMVPIAPREQLSVLAQCNAHVHCRGDCFDLTIKIKFEFLLYKTHLSRHVNAYRLCHLLRIGVVDLVVLIIAPAKHASFLI